MQNQTDSNTLEFLTVEELAPLLRRSVASVYSDLRRNPKSIPPHFCLPGSRRKFWNKEVVIEWLRKNGAFNGLSIAPLNPTTEKNSLRTSSKPGRPKGTNRSEMERRRALAVEQGAMA